ncbi:hypothetical protein HanXRQr2_Chr15g0681741 [Helianthus annuus]|uniref:Transposase (putative) gypsy type domain-containing protein n=1 Tax=Helianthus annuus TaxID=4232 RepID=A0A9K3DZN4_HELAN|nr:hypothetical protein HanXRQr2_Chr15g0681741 [Helianthus annuus]KAJ0450378.1 hypothetical protein HanHA300_Chr15g0555651 [Helianthus annuus]KAJ0472202.1 hypothetical protein HanHA89_Chr15g0604381 [Helianthus annuus]KAJ0647799.1 hypothetical protein HanLR1_Chr15g0565701 [Helianthus annuus]KAJ0651666.1 hypothetical protein HanOQP8_Chr15g0563441 [Helianthus annuus]
MIPFTNFFLEVLKYYRLSLGQLAPVGVPRIMHFEILCQALTYEPSLLMFRLFSGLPGTATGTPSRRLNVRHPSFLTPLVILILGRTSSFFISERLLPFTVVPRKFSEVLNEREPGVNDLDKKLLLRLRVYRAKLRAYPEELLVMLGVSQDWAESGFEPVLYSNDKVPWIISYCFYSFA